MTTEIAGISCTACNYPFELTTPIGRISNRPSAGSVSICIRCAAIGIFTRSVLGHLGLRKPTDVELASIMRQDHIRDAISAVLIESAFDTTPPLSGHEQAREDSTSPTAESSRADRTPSWEDVVADEPDSPHTAS